jgi:hypothetical protein
MVRQYWSVEMGENEGIQGMHSVCGTVRTISGVGNRVLPEQSTVLIYTITSAAFYIDVVVVYYSTRYNNKHNESCTPAT